VAIKEGGTAQAAMSDANETLNGRIATFILLVSERYLEGKIDVEQYYIHNDVIDLFRNCSRFKNYSVSQRGASRNAGIDVRGSMRR